MLTETCWTRCLWIWMSLESGLRLGVPHRRTWPTTSPGWGGGALINKSCQISYHREANSTTTTAATTTATTATTTTCFNSTANHLAQEPSLTRYSLGFVACLRMPEQLLNCHCSLGSCKHHNTRPQFRSAASTRLCPRSAGHPQETLRRAQRGLGNAGQSSEMFHESR